MTSGKPWCYLECSTGIWAVSRKGGYRPTQGGRRLRAIEGEGIGLLGVREAALADASGSVEEADGGEEHEQGADSGGQGYGAG